MTTTGIAVTAVQRQFVAFRVGADEFAVDVGQIQEIIRLTTITAVPRTPDFVEGVVNLRGRIVPVIDLARRFELPAGPRDRAARIVVTDVDGRTVGMIVDAVNEVVRLGPEAIEPAPEVVQEGIPTAFITGIGKRDGRLLIMLDLPLVLSARDRKALSAFGAEDVPQGTLA